MSTPRCEGFVRQTGGGLVGGPCPLDAEHVYNGNTLTFHLCGRHYQLMVDDPFNGPDVEDGWERLDG